MKNKKILSVVMALGLSTTLAACGNTADNTANTENTATTETVEEVETTEAPSTEEAAETATAEKSGIYDLEFGYLPEGFVENFADEKKDLRTVEYWGEKNPASKIQLQITDNADRLAELVEVPAEAEELEVAGESAKIWEDGSFTYLVVTKGENHIIARSTLDRDETIKVVEEIK